MEEKQNYTYVTFGQGHAHHIAGRTFGPNCVARIRTTSAAEGRKRAFELFGEKFCFEYHNKIPNMEFFPDGFVDID